MAGIERARPLSISVRMAAPGSDAPYFFGFTLHGPLATIPAGAFVPEVRGCGGGR